MINSFFESHPGLAAVFGFLGWLVTLVVEAYLGKAKPLDAASSLALLWKLIQAAIDRFRKRKGAPLTTNSTNPPAQVLSANPNARNVPVVVDGPTYDVMGIIVDAFRKHFAGEKSQQIAGEEIGAAMSQLGALQSIPADASLDLQTVENAVAVRMVELGEVIRAGRLAPQPLK